jgi:carbamoyltransferase
MANILAINPGHNGSVALCVDGELILYVEEERLSRSKYDGNPFLGIMKVIENYDVDLIVVIGRKEEHAILQWTAEDAFQALLRKIKKLQNIEVVYTEDIHHLLHAGTAFYNSGFKEAYALVVDGAGGLVREYIDQDKKMPANGFETESIWYCAYPSQFMPLFKSIYSSEVRTTVMNYDNTVQISPNVSLTKMYEAVTEYLGFGFIEAGKTMGLAPYGKEDAKIPKLTVDKSNKGKRDIFIPYYPAGSFIDTSQLDFLKKDKNFNLWTKDPSFLPDDVKNLAWRVQNDTQDLIIKYINNIINIHNSREDNKDKPINIVMSGGYMLNCVTNYLVTKTFPNINFYFEPISHDGGLTIGAAKIYEYSSRFRELEDTESLNVEDLILPQKTLYHGPSYSTDELKSKINELLEFEQIKTKEVSYAEVAQLIADRNIVAIYQGRSEAGPRALGNRSILYDPRDPNGKDYVNIVKGREWFRPFAGTVLKEDAHEWFDLAGMKETPFMMHAVNVVFDKVKEVPAITHVDDTCRVQTVTEEQNEHYYNLIKAFKEITGVPILFNTSFNLAGEPLVETLGDAFYSLFRSEMRYIYLPELGILAERNIPTPKELDKMQLEEDQKKDE